MIKIDFDPKKGASTIILGGTIREIMAESKAVFEAIYDSLCSHSKRVAMSWAMELTLAVAKKTGFNPEEHKPKEE